MAIKVKQMLVSSSKYSIKCPYNMNAEYITFHNTYNDASAENEIKYMIGNNAEVSYHFAVDDKEVVQGLPLNRNAWHTGDSGKGDGNRKSIGVEVCYSKSGGEKYKKAEELAIKFIAQLLHERGWGVDRVKTHKHWTEIGVKKGYSSYVKNCPHRVLDEGRWNQVLNRIQAELDKLKGNKSSATQPAPSVPKQDTKPTTSNKTYTSVVDYLNANKIDSSFNNRKKLAESYGVKNYTGTASQNTQLLDKLQSGAKPASKPKTETKPVVKGDMKTTSIVTYLNSIKEDSSFTNREKLAKANGIKNYKGTASQNTELLAILRDGKKSTSTKSSTTKKPATSSGIKTLGKIKIVGVTSAAIIMDSPDRNKAKNVGTIAKGKTIDISGSVVGKNNPKGYWEVIYNKKRCYISAQYGQRV